MKSAQVQEMITMPPTTDPLDQEQTEHTTKHFAGMTFNPGHGELLQ